MNKAQSSPSAPLTYRSFLEDFKVEEVPAYPACGEGEHLYLWIEKRGISTHEAIFKISKSLGIHAAHVGSAGLKDARGVSRQWISVQGIPKEKAAELTGEGYKILEAQYHKNKLRVGHLKGNRFGLKLRGESLKEDYAYIQDVFKQLCERGVPNYFGPQRFGLRGDNGRIGYCLIKEKFEEAVAWMVGNPQATDVGHFLKARQLFVEGKYWEAATTWPRGFHACVQICRSFEKNKNARQAIMALGKEAVWFYLSAFQSQLFNELLKMRIDEIDQLREGDLAFKHDNGAVFFVENVEQEMPRVRNFEISASGPLFGYQMIEPRGLVFEMENRILQSYELSPADFHETGILTCQGARRALRFPIQDPKISLGIDEHGDFVLLEFFLPRGCFATAVLSEIGKEQLTEA